MTAGQRLLELSGLSGISAGAHLLMITQSGGTGPGVTRFVSQMTVLVETPAHTLSMRATRVAPPAGEVAPAVEGKREGRNAYVLTCTSAQSVIADREEIFITEVREATTTVLSAPDQVTALRSRTVSH